MRVQDACPAWALCVSELSNSARIGARLCLTPTGFKAGVEPGVSTLTPNFTSDADHCRRQPHHFDRALAFLPIGAVRVMYTGKAKRLALSAAAVCIGARVVNVIIATFARARAATVAFVSAGTETKLTSTSSERATPNFRVRLVFLAVVWPPATCSRIGSFLRANPARRGIPRYRVGEDRKSKISRGRPRAPQRPTRQRSWRFSARTNHSRRKER